MAINLRRSVTPVRLVGLVLGIFLAGGALAYLSGPAGAALERVPLDHVCMVNNKYFPTPQIPVAVGSKTYFGCCEMCKGRLGTDERVRMAQDPVSMKMVDKAQAVVGMRRDGSVLYFESEDTLGSYREESPT